MRSVASLRFLRRANPRSTFVRREPRQRTLGGRGAAAGDPDQQRKRRNRRNRGENKERHPTELVGEYPAEVLLWFATAATRTFLHLLSHQAFEIQRHPLYRIDKSINRFPQPRGLIYGTHKVCNGVMDKGSK